VYFSLALRARLSHPPTRGAAPSARAEIPNTTTHSPIPSVKRGPGGVVEGPLSGRLLADKGAAPSDKEARLCADRDF
jgi:hypothetical protein